MLERLIAVITDGKEQLANLAAGSDEAIRLQREIAAGEKLVADIFTKASEDEETERCSAERARILPECRQLKQAYDELRARHQREDAAVIAANRNYESASRVLGDVQRSCPREDSYPSEAKTQAWRESVT